MFAFLFLLPFLCAGFSGWDADRVRRQVNNAMVTVGQVLNTTRHPSFAADVPHLYEDKYLLAEFLTNSAISAQLNAFDAIGITLAKQKQLQGWVNSAQTVGLAFRAQKSCVFKGNKTVQVENPTKRVTTVGSKVITESSFTTVTSYYWTATTWWELFAFKGSLSAALSRPQSFSQVDSRNVSFELKTSDAQAPDYCRNLLVLPPLSVDITWLFTQLGDDTGNRGNFHINREAKTCHTPRRNEPVEKALQHYSAVSSWASQIPVVLANFVYPSVQTAPTQYDSGVFVPILPLFEDRCPDTPASSSSASTDAKPKGTSVATKEAPKCKHQVVLSPSDMNAFLAEQEDSLGAKEAELSRNLVPRGNSSQGQSVVEGRLEVVCRHLTSITTAYSDGVESIEDMLKDQLVAAIGKEVSPEDFGQFIRFNNLKLFNAQYRPRDFSYAIRRPDHDPEGIVAIQQADGSTPLPFPISTVVREDRADSYLNVTLSGGTVISLGGARYLHTALFYQFSGQSLPSLSLAARARQFSSFVLMAGTIVSANEFAPKIAVIVKDKDDLLIPLLLENIPTPKAFRDAIVSLSPKQQAFAKAFRSMQLASTLFGVVVIEIKPQLEVLLRLPADSLTKEIQLTQDLMSLFIEYQIPADLLSVSAEKGNLSSSDKTAYVKTQVAQMKAMIAAEKQAEVDAKKQRDEMIYQQVRVPRQYSVRVPVPVAVPVRIPMAMPMMPMSAPGYSGSVANSGGAARATYVEYSPQPQTQRPQQPTQQQAGQQTQRQPVEVGQQLVEKHGGVDYTTIPPMLDQAVEKLDPENALSATIIKIGDSWQKTSQKGLMGNPIPSQLYQSEQVTEQKKAFDLLEALSRSGVLPFEQCALHVVIGSTQRFDETLLNTVIQQDRNPIDSMERSSLIIASTVLGKPARELVAPEQVPRLSGLAPNLFPTSETPQGS